MTSSTQHKFMDILEDIAKSTDFDMLIDYNFSNTGIIRFTRRSHLAAVLQIHFHFDRDYAGFTFTPTHSLGNNRDGQFHYVKFDELDEKIVKSVRHILLVEYNARKI